MKNDKILLIAAAGVAVVGGVAFLLLKPSSAAATTTPTTPSTDAMSATPTPQAAATTYSLTLVGDQPISLKVGQTLQFITPSYGSGWGVVVENHDGQMGVVPTTDGSLVVVAEKPGVSIARIGLTSTMGPPSDIFNISVSITS